MNNVNPNKYINSVEHAIDHEGGLSIRSSSKWVDSNKKQQQEYRSIRYIKSSSGFLEKIKNKFKPIVKNNEFLLSLYHEINKPPSEDYNSNPYYTISREHGHIILATHEDYNPTEPTPRCIKKFVSLKEKEKLEILSLLYPHIVNRLNKGTVFGGSDQIPLTLNEFSERQSSSAWEKPMTQLIDTISDQPTSQQLKSDRPGGGVYEFDAKYQQELSESTRSIPEEERENAFKQALSLIEPHNNILITPNDIVRLIGAMPMLHWESGERENIIYQAKKVITDTMSVSQRLNLAMPLKHFSSSERENIIYQTIKVITESMNAFDRLELMTTVLELPSSKRAKIIDQAKKKITDTMSVSQRLELIAEARNEIEEDETLAQANRVIKADMTSSEQQQLRQKVKKLPSNERAEIIDQTTQVMTESMNASDRLNLITTVLDLPSSERAEIIYLAKTVIPDNMTSSERQQLIDIVQKLPSSERAEIINQTIKVIPDNMTSSERRQLIEIVKELPPRERESIIDQAKKVIPDNMTSSERRQLIQKVRMIPADMRETIINTTQEIINKATEPQFVLKLINNVCIANDLNADMRKTIINKTQEIINKATEPQFVLELINNVCMANDLNLESFNNKSNPFLVNAKNVQTSPTKILVQYARQIAHWNEMPRIQYEDEPGNDAGGLTRAFIAELLKALFESSKQNKLIDDNHRLQADTPETCQVMRALGVIFGAALHLESFTTGQHFGPELFDIIKQIPTYIVKNLPKKINSIKDLTNIANHDKVEYKNFIEFYLKTTYPDAIELYKPQENHLPDDKIYNRILEEYPRWEKHILAIANIAQSMNTFLTDQNKNWETVVKDKNLSLIIEGQLTKQLLKQAITSEQDDTTEKSTEDTVKAKEVTKAWIDAQKGEEGKAKLVQFCEAVTGSPTLLPNQKIFVKGINIDNPAPFAFSTCARQLTVNWKAIPNNPKADLTFDTLLTAAISDPQQFNQA